MTFIQCPRCRRAFARETNFRRHQSRKTPCEPAVPEPAEGEEGRHCADCGRLFATKGSRDRHVRTGACAANPARDRIRELEDELASLRVGGGVSISNTNLGTVNNISITFNGGAPPRERGGSSFLAAASMRNFGNENLEHITADWLRSMLASIPLHLPAKEAGGVAIRKTMEGIWADSQHPENLTVIFTSPRKDPMILENGVWKTAPMAEIAAHMQSQAVQLATSAPLSKPTDQAVLKAVIEGEQGGTYLSTARSTMQNARTETRKCKGRLPSLGEETPTDDAAAPPLLR